MDSYSSRLMSNYNNYLIKNIWKELSNMTMYKDTQASQLQEQPVVYGKKRIGWQQYYYVHF